MEEKKQSRVERFRQGLNVVFDDNLHTRVWHNVVDWIIIALILISTVEVFLSTFETVNEKYGSLLHFVDVFTTAFFSVEVALRIWTADLLDPKYRGFWGRVKYCFSFYGLIDILSTYTFYVALIFPLPYVALKTLRIARLLRIFRYMKSFRLLVKAFNSKKSELGISLQFLSIITVILAFVLYFVENAAQPEVFDNGWKSVVWAFSQYIGDPGNFADYQPITFVGRLISTLIGVLGIAIFAVPAGLIGAGFLEAVEESNHKETVDANIDALNRAFERKRVPHLGYWMSPMVLSIPEIMARMSMKEDDIVEAVSSSDNFRIINMAATVPVDNRPQDRLVIEHFVTNRPYGCFIDRGSKITIVSPTAMIDPIIGHFAYYLAKIGGFNFVSREIGVMRPYRSFYLLNDLSASAVGYKEYFSDLQSLAQNGGHWIITLLPASGQNEPEFPHQVHFGYGNAKGDASLDSETCLLRDKAVAEELMSSLENRLESELDIKAERQTSHTYASPNLYIRRLENSKDINSLVIRLAWSSICWDSRRVVIAKTIADSLNSSINGEIPPVDPELLVKGAGYSDYKN